MARLEAAKPLSATPPIRSPHGRLREEPVPLTQLRPGARGLVVRVEAQGPIGRRLLDLGFIPGSEVRCVRRAPLGDPVAYEVRGSQLCLRGSDARLVWVRTGAADGG